MCIFERRIVYELTLQTHLRDHFSHQILRPSWLIHSVASRSNVVLQLNPSTRILNDRLWTKHVFANCSRMPLLEEFGVQDNVACVCLQHLQKARKRVAHIVVVAEDLLAIALPDIFPDVSRVHTNAVDEPLGVVVQSDLSTLVSHV